MRYGVRWQWDQSTFTATDRCEVQSVSTPYDRDWFLIVACVANNPTKFKVYAYDTRAQAEADYTANSLTHYIAGSSASYNNSTGQMQTVTLVKKTGAAFDPTPFTVTLAVKNNDSVSSPNWTLALCYHVADVESLLVERVQDILQQYTASHEALALLGVESADIYANPFPDAPNTPPISVEILLDAPLAAREFGTQGFEDTVALTLSGKCLNSDPDAARETAAQLATTLRAIALNQRTWGGIALETEIGQSMRPSVSEAAEAGYQGHCEVPLTVRIPGWAPAMSATYPLGYGGKYAYAASASILSVSGTPNPGGGVGHGGNGNIEEP